MDAVNKVSTKIFGKGLFRNPIPDQRPLELGVFVRPTAKNFQRFVVALEHVLSENINEALFPPSISRTEIKVINGRSVEQRVGSIRLLDEWLFDIYSFQDPEAARVGLIQPFQEVRKRRQRPAHSTTADEYDPLFYKQREEILVRVYQSLISMLEIFERHPNGYAIDLPKVVREGRLDPW